MISGLYYLFMTNVLKLTKKVFTVGVVATTIVWSLGVAALVPTVANAATCPTLAAGDMIKVTGKPAIYVVDNNLKPRYFDNGDVFKSWRPTYGGYISISMDCYDSLGTPSVAPYGISYRPGSYIVKRGSSDQLYVVEPNNTLATITVAAAKTLYGATYKVMTISDQDWPNYVNRGTAITEAKVHPGMLISNGGKNWYVDTDMKLREVTETGMTANGFQTKFVRPVTSAAISGLTTGDSITAEVKTISDKSQSGGVTTTTTSGSVTVSLAAGTPSSVAIPDAATHVAYTSFNVKADTATTIYSVGLKRVGLGDNDNFSKVWLEVNGVPVSNAQSVGSDDTVSLQPNYTMAAGSSAVFTVVANLANRTGMTAQEDGFEIASIDAGKGVTVFGLPVAGNKMSYRDFTPGTATLTDRGTDSNVKVGDTTIIGEFDVAFDSANDKDGTFEYIRFRNTGDADMSDLANIVLTENDTTISGTTEVSGDYVTFKIADANKKLTDGKTRRFAIKADIKDGDNAKVYTFVLKDARDAYVKDLETGYGAAMDISDLNDDSTDGSLKDYTLDAGQLTVSKDVSNPNNENYPKNTKSITALVAKIDLGQNVTVDGLKVYLHDDSDESGYAGTDESANIDADIEKVSLYRNDTRIASVSSVSGTGTDNNNIASSEYYFDFDSSFSLSDNDLLKVVIDLDNNATATDKYKFTFAATDFVTPEYTTSGQSVPSGSKSGTATGNLVTISASSFTMSRNDGYTTNETFTTGAKAVKLMQVLVSAGSASDLNLKTLNFDMSSTSMYNYFTNLYLTINGTKVEQYKDMNSSGYVTFTNLNKSIVKNGQATVALYTDVQSGLTNGATTTITLDDSDSLLEDAEGDQVNYSDVTSPALRFYEAGTLTASVDGDTTKSAIVAAGKTSAVELGTWKLVGKYGDLEVTDMYFANTDGTDVVTTADFLVSEYQLVWNGNVIASKAPTAGAVHFELDNSLISIAKDATTRVTLRAVLNGINTEANTGKQFIASLYGVEARAKGGSALTSITGVDATDPTYNNSTALDANAIVAYKTLPTLSTATLTGTLSDGARDVYKFNVGADSNGDVTWKVINLDLSGACTGGTVAVCMGATSSMKLKYNGTTVPATFTTSSGNLQIVLTGVQTVSAATTKSYTLEATLSGFSGDNDTLSIRIKDNQSAFAAPAAYSSVSQTDGFIWTDNSGDDEDTSASQWMDGYKVLGLDTDVFTLKR